MYLRHHDPPSHQLQLKKLWICKNWRLPRHDHNLASPLSGSIHLKFYSKDYSLLHRIFDKVYEKVLRRSIRDALLELHLPIEDRSRHDLWFWTKGFLHRYCYEVWFLNLSLQLLWSRLRHLPFCPPRSNTLMDYIHHRVNKLTRSCLKAIRHLDNNRQVEIVHNCSLHDRL